MQLSNPQPNPQNAVSCVILNDLGSPWQSPQFCPRECGRDRKHLWLQFPHFTFPVYRRGVLVLRFAAEHSLRLSPRFSSRPTSLCEITNAKRFPAIVRAETARSVR
jgi:hypothetical protein